MKRWIKAVMWAGVVGAVAAASAGCNSGSRKGAQSTAAGVSTASTTPAPPASGASPTSASNTTPPPVAPAMVTLTLTQSGSGTGQVVVEPQPTSGTYATGTTVILRAIPDNGMSFLGWGGFRQGDTHHELEIVLTQDTTLDANFEVPTAGTPTAGFTIQPDPAMGTAPLMVNFKDASTGSPGRYEWDFGDSTSGSTLASPTHTFTQPGEYTIALRVYDAQGNQGLEDVRFGAVVVVDSAQGSRFWYQGDAYGNPIKTNDPADAAAVTQIVDLVNAERAKVGAPPLAVDADAEEAAKAHTDDMVARAFFDHITPEGWTPADRLRAAQASSYTTVAENIAQAADPASAMQSWMNSPGHRANILNPALTHIGVGINRTGGLYTQVFLTK
jgi:uncharacterized protein YkwD